MNGRGPSMMHSINEEPPRKHLGGDVTSHCNLGSVSKALKWLSMVEYQSASPRLRSFRCTPEWTLTANDSHKGPAIKKFRKCDPKFLQWRQPCGELKKSTVRALAGSHLYLSEVSMPSKGTEEMEEIKK